MTRARDERTGCTAPRARLTSGEQLALALKTVQAGECRPFTGGVTQHFGHKRVRHGGSKWLAHRLAWTLTFGPIPSGLCVCHRCDVPSCINPGHLFLGTRGDNNVDRGVKGRTVTARGSRHPHSKLTEWKVKEILRKIGEGRTVCALSQEYDVSLTAVYRIRSGEGWAHVARSPGVDPCNAHNPRKGA